MKNNNYHVLGVMSGTSLDGVDITECFFEISREQQWSFTIGASETIEYPTIWKRTLQQAVQYSEEKLTELDENYTDYLSQIISAFISKHQITDIDAVCSHGHTVLHEPEKGVTFQIGNLPKLATLIKQKVVCDFRVQDVNLGGQGAPLVPVGDAFLFPEYDYCLNLGGFANCSFEKNGKRIAYDICPVNIVLNLYAEKLGEKYDDKGEMAASGELNSGLLNQLNHLNFYNEEPPKSLGLEWVKAYIFPILETSGETYRNILRTFTEHIAIQLGRQFSEGKKVLATGGGVYNSFLIDRFKSLRNVELVVPSNQLIGYKEALVFGLLGILKLRDQVNCLSSVTGAKENHSSGLVFHP
ncbi:anhydro-N-acetylmuramic acid kinase [Marixanthomonas spongiae]|uniref:Anhydro-N-acetylmuramic acid kinase n=1 Tax=Marixanthomonas spongiae TaxID=2174845 RepID=A0A2U0HTI5_9FLAO|nr:anhydro-N-acetylmuramic acid kinase [Marixanthomonas spongiae]PVW12155.1 anhydro-N-acetylmuramic acid kinase [Marixanthomonas spongiae]